MSLARRGRDALGTSRRDAGATVNRTPGRVVSIETTPPKPAGATDWDLHSHQDKELVKGLGLTSATMLVMGSMIGSGIFIVSAEICARGRFARAADRCLAGDRLPDHRRRPELRRTGGHDAARRRPVRLSARSARAAVGISIRLDAVSGDPDRHHRRGRSGLRQVSRHLLSLDFVLKLDCALLESSAHSYWPDGPGKYGSRPQHAEPGRHSGGGRALGHQYLRRENRRVDPERFYRRQGFGPAGPGVARAVHRTQCAGAGGKLSGQLLAQRITGGATRGAGGSRWPDGAGRHADHSCGGAGGIAIFRRCLEQRHLYRRRSKESQPQPAAVAGPRYRRGDRACTLPATLFT